MSEFVQSLEIMAFGLIGIFVVIGVVYLCVRLLNAIGAKQAKKD